jgi:hypothetical protein
MVGFTKEAIDLTEERWEAVQDYNACLERLLIRRKNEIAIQDAFVESKTGWKCAILQQALLYRVRLCPSRWCGKPVELREHYRLCNAQPFALGDYCSCQPYSRRVAAVARAHESRRSQRN